MTVLGALAVLGLTPSRGLPALAWDALADAGMPTGPAGAGA
jgi:hypothetical protein